MTTEENKKTTHTKLFRKYKRVYRLSNSILQSDLQLPSTLILYPHSLINIQVNIQDINLNIPILYNSQNGQEMYNASIQLAPFSPSNDTHTHTHTRTFRPWNEYVLSAIQTQHTVYQKHHLETTQHNYRLDNHIYKQKIAMLEMDLFHFTEK
jgi:hypothetical protein